MVRKWRSKDDSFNHIDVEAVIRNEALIKLGEARTHRVIVSRVIITSTPVQCYANVFAEPMVSKGISLAHKKVEVQMRRIGPAKTPIEEVEADGEFIYPRDKVINIRRGRRLNNKRD
jgi:hypothetical protein